MINWWMLRECEHDELDKLIHSDKFPEYFSTMDAKSTVLNTIIALVIANIFSLAIMFGILTAVFPTAIERLIAVREYWTRSIEFKTAVLLAVTKDPIVYLHLAKHYSYIGDVERQKICAQIGLVSYQDKNDVKRELELLAK